MPERTGPSPGALPLSFTQPVARPRRLGAGLPVKDADDAPGQIPTQGGQPHWQRRQAHGLRGQLDGSFRRIANRGVDQRDGPSCIGEGNAAPSEGLHGVEGVQPVAEGLRDPIGGRLTRGESGDARATQPTVEGAVEVTGEVLHPPLP